MPSKKDLPPLEKALPFILLGTALVFLTFEEGARMYLPFFALSYGLGALVYYLEKARLAPGTSLWGFMFPKDVWMHRSARQDYAIALINMVLAATIFPYLVLNYDFYKDAILSGIAILSPHADTNTSDKPGTFAIVTFTLLSFMLSDLFYYWSHRLTHRVMFLWEFHKLHHSAEVMTPVTLHRAHPIDILFNVGMRMMGLGVASAIFYALYPNNHGLLTITGSNIFLIICYVAGANLRHSHIWLSYGPTVERVMMSPAQHQIHHSTDPAHFNRNYGADMSLWDWVFGSLYIPREKESVTFGLGDQHDNEQSLWQLYIGPFKKSARILRRRMKKRFSSRKM